MKTLLEFLLNHLVTNPEDVSIEETEDDLGAVYSIRVNEEDMGRVIGRGGRVIRAIRKATQIRSHKDDVKARIVLED